VDFRPGASSFPGPGAAAARQYTQLAGRLSRRLQAVDRFSLLSTGSAHRSRRIRAEFPAACDQPLIPATPLPNKNNYNLSI